MSIEAGPILFAMLFGVLLASGAAWVVAWLYRRRMLGLMRVGPSPSAAHVGPLRGVPVRPAPRSARLDLSANRRASLRHVVSMTALSVLIGLTQSWLALLFVYEDGPFSIQRLIVLGAVYAWPMVLGWGLLRRWSWGLTTAVVVAYMMAMVGLVMLASDDDQTLSGVSVWLGGVVAIPVVVTLLIGASGRIRAVAPYFLPFFLLLSATSVFALELLALGVNDPPDWLLGVIGVVGAWGVLLLIVFVPWLVLAWPLWATARGLAAAYRAKRFSDLEYLFSAYWFVVLAASALPALQAVGFAGLTQILPWLWIPLSKRLFPKHPAPAGDPPTLLVLRVFQRDTEVEILFDRVVERWRLTGNTLLIAGTDLVSRTLDPDDLFAFLDRRLAERFVATGEDVANRVAAFDLAADPDGRYRINECYCFDTTWQFALAALVGRADVVLMDLRGFAAGNLGCRHELGVLADAGHLRRVVVLYDASTARDVAEAEIAGVRAGQFVWIEAGRLGSATAKKVLSALLIE